MLPQTQTKMQPKCNLCVSPFSSAWVTTDQSCLHIVVMLILIKMLISMIIKTLSRRWLCEVRSVNTFQLLVFIWEMMASLKKYRLARQTSLQNLKKEEKAKRGTTFPLFFFNYALLCSIMLCTLWKVVNNRTVVQFKWVAELRRH